MSCKVEKIGTNKAKFTIEIPNEEFLKAEDKVFNKDKGKLSIPGFRKGKVTKDMAFKVYGRNCFLEETVNECINETYTREIKTCDVRVLSRPVIDVTQVDVSKNFIYTAEVAIVPEVKIDKYKGIELKKTEVKVTDEDVENALKEEQEKNARVVSVDRKSKLGDIVSIDFEGFVDGKPFKGGKAEKYQLTLGSKSFIDTFEDQLVDKAIGEDVDVNVTFPENYGEKSLAGKPALFKCKVNEVKEKQLPPIDDEFASEVSEFDTLAEYKADIKKKIETARDERVREMDEQRLLDEIVKNTKIDLAEEAIESQIEEIIYDYENRMRYQGLTFENYLKAVNKTLEDFKKDQRGLAEKQIKQSIVLEEIGKLENIEASDEMVNEHIKKMAESYGMDVKQFEAAYANPEDKKRIKEDLKFPAVLKFLYDNAKLS